MSHLRSVHMLVFWVLIGGTALAGEIRTGTAKFIPTVDEASVPERFRLPPDEFRFEQTPLKTYSKSFEIFEVKFPSPVETPHLNNNTVHCEYFRPRCEGKHPGVIVLHILGGDFDLARLFCRSLAAEGTAALFLKMP